MYRLGRGHLQTLCPAKEGESGISAFSVSGLSDGVFFNTLTKWYGSIGRFVRRSKV